MPIKWTERDAIQALRTLTNPFEAVTKTLLLKPKLSDVVEGIRNNGGTPTQEILT